MTAEFKEKEPLKGFDPKARWQMVPLTGERIIRLIGGAGLALVGFVPSEPAGLIWEELGSSESPTREIRLKGRQPGHYWIELRDPKTMEPRLHLDVSVLPERVINAAYYIIQTNDTKEDVFTQAEVRDIFGKAREVLLHQANVRLESVEIASLSHYQSGLGATVGNITIEERQQLMRAGNHTSAAHLVYFVRSIRTDSSREAEPAGLTFVNFTLIKKRDVSKHPYHLTLAHETGHFLSGETQPRHDNSSKENLMFGNSPHGAFLSKEWVLRWFPDLN